LKAPLSAVLITRNAANVLDPCLESLAFVDDIVIVDSGSTDRTAEIARERGARMVQKEWLGFGRQKQFAVEQAKHDWVLCVDADERVSPELATSIEMALAAPVSPVYRMPRRNRFLGRWLAHGEGYPDWSPRLFNRQNARWSDDLVHEKVLYAVTPGTLAGDLMHDSSDDLSAYLERQNRYTDARGAPGLRAGTQRRPRAPRALAGGALHQVLPAAPRLPRRRARPAAHLDRLHEQLPQVREADRAAQGGNPLLKVRGLLAGFIGMHCARGCSSAATRCSASTTFALTTRSS
jgi:hypothetical protein